MKSLNYQSHLDILRGLSILMVVLYHLKLNIFNYSFFSGGFLGVDIFFVISGYLITSILSLNINNEKFSYTNFYKRRFLRIVPIYIFVIFVVLVLSYYLLLPLQLTELSKSSLSSFLFLSNIFFWRYVNDYYNPDAILNPLLHTWSLSIEIQFYIFFPIFFFLIKKFIKKIHLSFLVTGLVSLLISEIFSRISPYVNFYGFQSRLWEFILGSFVYFYREKINLNLNCIIKYLLYLAIILSSIFFDENVRHPSLITFFFLLIVSILILNKDDTNNTYFERALKFFGLISYSLYLWHYPIISFSNKLLFEINLNIKIILFLLSIIVSYFSYYFIEKKLRIHFRHAYYFVAFFICGSLILIFLFITSNGYPQRIKASEFYKNNIKSEIQSQNLQKLNYFNFFSKENLLVVGNSHAVQTYQGFLMNEKLFKNINFSHFHIQIHCLGENIFKQKRDVCKGFFNFNERQLFEKGKKNLLNSNYILLSTRWTEQDIESLPRVINFLKKIDKKIIIFGSIVDMSKGQFYYENKSNKNLSIVQKNFLRNIFPYERYLFLKNNYPEDFEFTLLEKQYYKNTDKKRYLINTELKKIAKIYNIPFLDINNFVCDHQIQKCKILADKKKHIMYDTTGHLTYDGMNYLTKIIKDFLIELIKLNIK